MSVINKHNIDKSVKFVSYTGKYPNLCSGVLTLEIDGVQYKFGHEYMNYDINTNTFTDEDPQNPNFERFWYSGGCVNWNEKERDFEVKQDEWIINAESLPEQFWDIADEIDEVFNRNVRQGCCGGCI